MSINNFMKRTVAQAFKVIDNQCLIIDGHGYFLGKSHDRIIIKHKNSIVSQIPFEDITCIILSSKSTTLSTSFINDASRHGICISMWCGGSPNILVASSRLASFVEAKRAQFDAYNNTRGLELIKKVIASKIENQNALLRYYSKNLKAAKLDSTSESLRVNAQKVRDIVGENISAVRTSVLSFEALSSKTYWKRFAELLHLDYGFSSRDPSSNDTINSALNYGYAILYSITWMGILNSGLEPFAGFLHTDRPGKPSLVFDLSEPFKQRIVDRSIMAIVNNKQHLKSDNGMLDTQSKKLVSSKVLGEMYKKENYCGRNLTLMSIMQANIYSVVSELKGTGKYNEYKFKW